MVGGLLGGLGHESLRGQRGDLGELLVDLAHVLRLGVGGGGSRGGGDGGCCDCVRVGGGGGRGGAK